MSCSMSSHLMLQSPLHDRTVYKSSFIDLPLIPSYRSVTSASKLGANWLYFWPRELVTNQRAVRGQPQLCTQRHVLHDLRVVPLPTAQLRSQREATASLITSRNTKIRYRVRCDRSCSHYRCHNPKINLFYSMYSMYPDENK